MNNKEIIMISSTHCGHCSQAKEVLKDKIENGKVRVLSVEKDKAASDIANEYNINHVPTFVIRDKVTKVGEACSLSTDATKLICQNKEVEL